MEYKIVSVSPFKDVVTFPNLPTQIDAAGSMRIYHHMRPSGGFPYFAVFEVYGLKLYTQDYATKEEAIERAIDKAREICNNIIETLNWIKPPDTKEHIK